MNDVHRIFPSWTAFAEYLAMLGACVAGIGALPWWVGIILPSILLLLLSWPRWRELVGKAWRMDEEWMQLGDRVRKHGIGTGLEYYIRAKNAAFVLAAKVAHDAFHIALAFGFGHAARWFWFA